jgi:hypothetical protein
VETVPARFTAGLFGLGDHIASPPSRLMLLICGEAATPDLRGFAIKREDCGPPRADEAWDRSNLRRQRSSNDFVGSDLHGLRNRETARWQEQRTGLHVHTSLAAQFLTGRNDD